MQHPSCIFYISDIDLYRLLSTIGNLKTKKKILLPLWKFIIKPSVLWGISQSTYKVLHHHQNRPGWAQTSIMNTSKLSQNKPTSIVHRVWMVIVVVLLCSTQIFAQGVTVGDTTTPGGSMLNVKPTTNGPGLSVGDATHIAIPAPPNGASIQGQLLVGTTTISDVKVIIDGTGHILAVLVEGKMYFSNPDKGITLTGLSGNCWQLGVEEQMDGLTAIPKLYKVTCPP